MEGHPPRGGWKMGHYQGGGKIHKLDYSEIPFGVDPIMINEFREHSYFHKRKNLKIIGILDRLANTLPTDMCLDVSAMDLDTGLGCTLISELYVYSRDAEYYAYGPIFSINRENYVVCIKYLESISGENLNHCI